MKKIPLVRLSDFRTENTFNQEAGTSEEKWKLNKNRIEGKQNRYGLLDSLRGMVLISMIIYHGAWNMVYLYGYNWPWYQTKEAYFWQQSICWTFILLSGFCWSMGKNPLKNGLTVFASGLLVTLATLVAMPQNRVVFGVLTCIGSCILLMTWLNRFFQKLPHLLGAVLSFSLFILLKNVNSGYLGVGGLTLVRLPQSWYQGEGYSGYLGAYLGFPPKTFFSTDYFSLFPWFFLFLTGYFLYGLFKKKGWLDKGIFNPGIPGVQALGRHSLLIYLLHQPLLYLAGSMVLR